MLNWLFIALVLSAVFALGYRVGRRREQRRMVASGDVLKRWASMAGVAPGDTDQQTRERILRSFKGPMGVPFGVPRPPTSVGDLVVGTIDTVTKVRS